LFGKVTQIASMDCSIPLLSPHDRLSLNATKTGLEAKLRKKSKWGVGRGFSLGTKRSTRFTKEAKRF